MTRYRRQRMVGFIPENRGFYPESGFGNETVLLNIEELESIRLSDIEQLDQTKCAEKMGVSRTTFQRIIYSARNKIADALVNGSSIKIDGGDYMFNNGIGRGQGGNGRGLSMNTTGKCLKNPNMPAGYKREFRNQRGSEQSLEDYAKSLKDEYERVSKMLDKENSN